MNKLSRKAVRNISITTCGVFAALFLASGIFFYLVTGTVSSDEWGVERIKPTSALASGLDEKVDDLIERIDTASSGTELQLTITQEEATSKLDEMARDGDIAIYTENPQVYFGQGTVCASARISLGVEMDTAVQVEIKASNGKADVTIKRLEFDKLAIPKTLINNVMTAVEHELIKRWDASPVTVEEIDIRQGVMTITMVKK